MPHLVAQQAQALSKSGLIVLLNAGHGSVNVGQHGQHTSGHAHAAELNGFGFLSHEALAHVLNFSLFVGDFLLGEFGTLECDFERVSLFFRLRFHFLDRWFFGRRLLLGNIVNRRFLRRLVGHQTDGTRG